VRAEEVARARFGEPNRRLSSRRELRYGRKGSLAVAIDGPRAGAWYDHESGRGGWLTEGDRPAPERPRRASFAPDPVREEIVRGLVAGSMGPLGTPVESYLRSRAIEPPYPHCVRFLPRQTAMIALAQDGGGLVRAVQLVFLTGDGRKADVAVAKRTLKAGDGWAEVAAVRMPGRGRLTLCEGVETALSAWKATGRPTWACLGSSNLAKAPVWPRRSVVLARDGDPPGGPADEAVRHAVVELRARGVEVSVASPPLGLDWQDVHVRDGIVAVRKGMRR
jgi:Toprim domain-containing protein